MLHDGTAGGPHQWDNEEGEVFRDFLAHDGARLITRYRLPRAVLLCAESGRAFDRAAHRNHCTSVRSVTPLRAAATYPVANSPQRHSLGSLRRPFMV